MSFVVFLQPAFAACLFVGSVVLVRVSLRLRFASCLLVLGPLRCLCGFFAFASCVTGRGASMLLLALAVFLLFQWVLGVEFPCAVSAFCAGAW